MIQTRSIVDPARRANDRVQKELNEYGSTSLLDAVLRPDNGGVQGKRIDVVANLFPITFISNLQIFQYEVRFVLIKCTNNDDKLNQFEVTFSRPITLSIFQQALTKMDTLTDEQRKSIFFDGVKNAVTRFKLPMPTECSVLEVEVPFGDGLRRERSVKMIIKQTAQFDLDIIKKFISAEPSFIKKAGQAFVENLACSLQAINIAIRMDAIQQYRTHRANGNRFFDPNRAKPIAEGAEIWQGFFQSALPLRGGFFINFDLAFSPFLSTGPLLEVAEKVLNRYSTDNHQIYHGGRKGGRGNCFDDRIIRQTNQQSQERLSTITRFNVHDLHKLRKAFRNVMIALSYRKHIKPKPFRGFTGSSAQVETFSFQGREVTIAQYFNEKHNIHLRHPHLPCAILGRESRNQEVKLWVPLELCLITESAPIPPQKLSSQQTQGMIRIAAQRPEIRLIETIEWRKIRAYEKNKKLKSWGITVFREPVKVEARRIMPPQIAYQDGILERPLNGSWNLRSVRFAKSCVPLQTPVVINFTHEDGKKCEELVYKLLQKCQHLGMNVQASNIRCVDATNDRSDLKTIIQNAAQEAYNYGGRICKPQLIICFLDPTTAVYHQIKRISMMELPTSVPTQCMDVRKALNERGQAQYMSGVASKINMKLAGICHILPNPQDLPLIGQNTMLIGIDVRNSSARFQRDSVVAAVTTLNGQGTRFGSQIITQFNPNLGHHQEAIMNGKELFFGLLKSWKESNGSQLPQNIIVFRDGVSQGEYMQIKELEVTQLKQACADIKSAGNEQPRIVYLIATKRHHIRFFPRNPKEFDQYDKSGNLPAGTVIDDTVVHPYIFEFYLYSHSGLVGCNRPCKYTVLHDEMHFSSDSLQRLINSLSYSYQRTTRSVSRPPLAMYAHLLAEKATNLLFPESTSETSSIGSQGAQLVGHSIEEVRQRLEEENINPLDPRTVNLVNFGTVPWFL